MFKLIKNEFIEYAHLHADENLLINRNPYLMKKLCLENPEFIKYAKFPALNMELFNIVINHKRFYKDMIKDIIYYNESFCRHPEIMKKVCSMDGTNLKDCQGKAATFENIQIALKAPLPEDKSKIKKYIRSMDLRHADPKEIKKIEEYDGATLKNVSINNVTKELMEIALNNPDPKRRADINSLYRIRDSRAMMKYACEIDGLNFIFCGRGVATRKLLKTALSHTDPKKRLTFERVPESTSFTIQYGILRELILQDERWIKLVDLEDISKNELIEILKNTSVLPPSFIIEKYKNSKTVLTTLTEEVKKDKYSKDALKKMLSFEIDRKFINSNCFKQIATMLCEKENISFDFFKYIMERAASINKEALISLEFDFLNSRYHKIYEKNGYEKLFTLIIYPHIQEKIITLSNPTKEDGTIDIELGNKRLELLSKLLDKSVIDKNGNEIKDWIPYFNAIILDVERDIEKFDYFVKHQEELTDDLLNTLTNHILGKHGFKIKTIDDLKNYEKIRNEYIESCKNSGYKDEKKTAAFEKIFGISPEMVELFNPYIVGVLISPELFHPDIVDFFKTINQISNINITDKEILEKTMNRFDSEQKLDEKSIILLRSILKKEYVKKYNETLFKTTGKEPDDILDGIKVYKVAGENGDKPFNLSIHVLSAYLHSVKIKKRSFNYKEDWNRPIISNHGICSSYIGNSFFGSAENKYTTLGFDEYEDNALLLAGPNDIYSDNVYFDTMNTEDEKSMYLMPKDMLDYTRHNHNEMVFERKDGNKKRQPSYIVLICDDYDNAIKKYKAAEKSGKYNFLRKKFEESNKTEDNVYHSIKAAKEFGIPIVVVECEKIAKFEYDKINGSSLKFSVATELTRDEIKQYFHDTITSFANHYAACQHRYPKLIDKYFNKTNTLNIMETITNKIEETRITNPELAMTILEEYENAMELERKKSEKSTYEAFPVVKALNYCNQEKMKIFLATKKEQNIICVFDGSMDMYSDRMEFLEYVNENLFYSQASIHTIQNELKIDKIKKIFSTIEEFKKEQLYLGEKPDKDFERHIEDVTLFATYIGQKNLSERDLDLLMDIIVCHKSKRINEEQYTKEELKIVQSVIDYYNYIEKGKNDHYDGTFDKIIEKLEMESETIYSARKIIKCLCDAYILDNTRLMTSDIPKIREKFNFTTSHELVEVAMQINEHYINKDLKEIALKEKPEVVEAINEVLNKTKSPKMALLRYKKNNDVTDVNNNSEEVNKNAKRR